ncbi:MAG: carbon-nitrogen hydrolase family protein [Halofilum sp. (in: g-proteobacteria)]|nr:carbon-nitrogen hydrolase family protein [Halofilum sp. (in: g-proteobacteria)]
MNRVAAIQMASGPNVQANLDQTADLLAEAAGRGARLVALPENFGLIGKDERVKLDHAEADGHGPMQDFLAAAAARHGVWIIGGTVPLATPAGNRIRQSLLVHDAAGRRVARYDKMHLFDVRLEGGESYRESSTIEPGEELVALDSPLGRLGLTICYDLRFPELYRQLGAEGAEIFVAPSAFTKVTGRAHWEVLVRARAIENLAFVLAPAQGGYHVNERETWGHSMIVDPWGTVLAQRDHGTGVVVADLDPQMLARTRQNFPAIQHRRLA